MSSANETRADSSGDRKLAVFFDGACPLCQKEIDFYRKKDHAGEIDWIDVSRCESGKLGSDLTREDALRRFHVRSSSGVLLSGSLAFAEIWRSLPGFRWIGRMAQNRALSGLLEIAYRSFLVIRPTVQRIYRQLSG